MHTLPQGKTVFHTLKLNLVTEAEIIDKNRSGIGTPPWVKKPETEIGEEAEKYARSYMGRLLPLSRFVHLTNDGRIHITSGISYPALKDTGIGDISVSVRKIKDGAYTAVRAETQRRPWRQLSAVLAFSDTDKSIGCAIVKKRCNSDDYKGILCFGINLSEQAGEQYFSGTDGFVEEKFVLHPKMIENGFLNKYTNNLNKIDKISKCLYAAVKGYYDDINAKDIGKKKCDTAVIEFWQRCDTLGEKFVAACETGNADEYIRKFIDFAKNAYSNNCPKQGARNLMAFIAHRPNINLL